MKIKDILGFPEFYAQIKDQTMPFSLSYLLYCTDKKVEKEFIFYREKLTNILKDYCELDEHGAPLTNEQGNIKIKVGNEQECVDKIAELQDVEVDIAPMFTIKDFADINIAPNQISLIAPFLK